MLTPVLAAQGHSWVYTAGLHSWVCTAGLHSWVCTAGYVQLGMHSWVCTAGCAQLGCTAGCAQLGCMLQVLCPTDDYVAPPCTHKCPHIPLESRTIQTFPSIRVVLRPSSLPTVPKSNHSHMWLATKCSWAVDPADAGSIRYTLDSGKETWGKEMQMIAIALYTHYKFKAHVFKCTELNKIYKFSSFLLSRKGLMYHRLAQNSLVAKDDPKLLDWSASTSGMLGLQPCAATPSSSRAPCIVDKHSIHRATFQAPYIIFLLNNAVLDGRPEPWPRSPQEVWGPDSKVQKTELQLSAHTWQITTVCNSCPKGSDTSQTKHQHT